MSCTKVSALQIEAKKAYTNMVDIEDQLKNNSSYYDKRSIDLLNEQLEITNRYMDSLADQIKEYSLICDKEERCCHA